MGLKIGVGLFTGQIPGDSDRSPDAEYAEMLELVRITERAGLDSAWVSEHHFAADGYLPSLLPVLGAFAAVTERIELGTGVLLAPFHDPIRLAEDFAVVDRVSGGRTIAGLGIGWRQEEFRAFNISTASRTRRLIETVQILRRAWTQERFSYSGKHYSYDRVAVTPKPARTPPILLGGFVDAAVARAGRIGDGYIMSRGTLERAQEAFGIAARARTEAGHGGPPMVAALKNGFVTENPQRDWGLVAAGIAHQYGVYAGWRAGTDAPGRPLEVMPPREDDISAATAYGTPQDVVAALRPLAAVLGRYPDAHLVVRLHYPGMALEPAARAIELMGREVAPRLRSEAACA